MNFVEPLHFVAIIVTDQRGGAHPVDGGYIMKKFAIMAGGTIGSYAGWYLGALFGEFGIPLLLSAIGGVAGVILVWIIVQRYS